VTALVGGVGTGSTLIGLGRGFRESGHHVSVIGVEPAPSEASGGPPWDNIEGLRNTQIFHWDDFLERKGVDNYGRSEVSHRLEATLPDALEGQELLKKGGIEATPAAGAIARSVRDMVPNDVRRIEEVKVVEKQPPNPNDPGIPIKLESLTDADRCEKIWQAQPS